MMEISIKQTSNGKWIASLENELFTTKLLPEPHKLQGIECETPETALSWLMIQIDSRRATKAGI